MPSSSRHWTRKLVPVSVLTSVQAEQARVKEEVLRRLAVGIHRGCCKVSVQRGASEWARAKHFTTLGLQIALLQGQPETVDHLCPAFVPRVCARLFGLHLVCFFQQ